jgi:hypothetical protein
VSTTPHLNLNGITGFPHNFYIGSSSIGSSKYSTLSDIGKSPSQVETLNKTHQVPNQNKENIIPTPHNSYAARTNNTPLADISSSVANQQATTHDPSTQKTGPSATLLQHKISRPRAKIKQLQVNLANKFSSANTNTTLNTHLEVHHILGTVADSRTNTKRKQTTLLPIEIPLTQHDSSDSSDHESFNDQDEDDSSDEDGPAEHIGMNWNTPQGL